MKISIITAAVLAGFAGTSGAQVNFDQGVDLKGAVSQAVSAPLQLPEAKNQRFSRYTRDCSRFTFDATGAEATSEKVSLTSTEYVEVCHNTGGNPQYGGGGPVCFERPGMTWRQAAQVHIAARALLPWEKETFEVCMEGPWVNLGVVDAAYKYSVGKTGDYDTLFNLVPQSKVAMKPDADGINTVSFSYDKESKKFKFSLSDKWAKEYAGEKTAVTVEVYRDIANWFDGYNGKAEFTLDAASSYDLAFGFSDLKLPEPPQHDFDHHGGHDFKSADDRGAKNYYVKWGFKRDGKISKDSFVKKGETARVVVE